MTSSSVCTLESTRQWFLKAEPNPTSKNISTQVGCHLEEVAEMLETISSIYKDDAKILASLHDAINYVADRIKQNGGIVAKDRIGLLDSIADQIVTATGVGTFLGMNVPGALA